jgi:hypothetical protein
MLGRSPKNIMPSDHYNYADQRRVIIEVCEDFYSNDPPIRVYSFVVDEGVVENSDTIPKAILNHLQGKDGYSLEERRSITECGASGAIQEISLAIVSGIAGGLAAYSIDLIRGWKKPNASAICYTDEELIETFSETIKRSYKPYGELNMLEQTSDTDSIKAIFRDDNSIIFNCSIDRDSGFITIIRSEKTNQ